MNLGLDPTSAQARTAVSLVRDKVTWGPEFGNSPFFEGEVEPCINGGVLALGGYFGETSDRLGDRLLGRAAHRRWLELRGGAGLRALRVRAQEYLLNRRMFRRLSSGKGIDLKWARFTFPTMWHYDVLRGLDYLCRAGVAPDERVAEAAGLVAERRQPDGRWLLDEPHRDAVHDLEGGAGQPSRWNTLRALRVLHRYSAQD